jgi:hypothetical protein
MALPTSEQGNVYQRIQFLYGRQEDMQDAIADLYTKIEQLRINDNNHEWRMKELEEWRKTRGHDAREVQQTRAAVGNTAIQYFLAAILFLQLAMQAIILFRQ